jgi:hypothetical protein
MKTEGSSQTFREEMDLVAAMVRELPPASWGWMKTLQRWHPSAPEEAGEGWVR